MSVEAAQLVLFAITGLGAIIWVVALNFLSRCYRSQQPTELLAFGDPVAAHGLIGGAEVDGQPRQLAARAATVLAHGSQSSFGPVKIVEKTDERIVFERPETGIGNRSAGNWFRRAELRFTAVSSTRTRVEWLVEPVSIRWFLQLGVLFQIVGLLALVFGCAFIHTYVAASPDPAVRWQTLQMIQVVHFLWPPFLFGGLYRRGLRAAPNQLDALVNNLPYLNG
jgi:hypothetical protein